MPTLSDQLTRRPGFFTATLAVALAVACVADQPDMSLPDSPACAGVTFTEEETEASVGYSRDELLEVREWVFPQAIPVLSTVLDEETLLAQDPLPQAPTTVQFDPALVEAQPILSFWADETNGRCVPDFLVSGEGSLSTPDIDIYFEGEVRMQRVLSAVYPAGEPAVNQTSFEVLLVSESPELPAVFGFDPTHASATLHLPVELEAETSAGLVKARLSDRDYYYLYWK